MRLNVLLAVSAVILLTLPGFAGQFAGAPTLDQQLVRLAKAQAEFSPTLDPNGAPRLSIVLPTNRSGLAALLGDL